MTNVNVGTVDVYLIAPDPAGWERAHAAARAAHALSDRVGDRARTHRAGRVAGAGRGA